MDIQLDKKNTRHRFATGMVVLALVVFALLCLWVMNLFSSEKVAQMSFANTRLYQVQRRTFTDTMMTRAVAIPSESIVIASESGGTVTEIRQSASSEVKKGTSLPGCQTMTLFYRSPRALPMPPSKLIICVICADCWRRMTLIAVWPGKMPTIK